jgi:hypothetical protein
MSRSINSKAVAALIFASAVLVPVAQAAPIDPPTASDTVQSAQVRHQPSDPVQSAQVRHGLGSTYATDTTTPSRTATVEASSNGFDWGDAAIGAGVMLALIAVGSGAVLGFGRSRSRRGRPVPAS